MAGANPYGEIPCPKCPNTTTKVRSTQKYKGQFCRTRICLKCQTMFNTYEVSADEAKLLRQIKKMTTR